MPGSPEKLPSFVLPLALGFAVSLAYPLIFALAELYGMCGGCGTVTVRPEMIGFMIGGFALALYRKEFRSSSFAPLSPLLLGFATGVVLPEFFGCPWCMFMQLGTGGVERLPQIGGFIAGIWGGSALLRRGAAVEAGPTWRIPTRLTQLLILAVVGGSLWWMKENMEVSGSRENLAMAGVVLVGIVLGAAMQRIRFCLVEGLRNTFLIPSTTAKGVAPLVGMVGGAFLYGLARGELAFLGLDLTQGDVLVQQIFVFTCAGLAGMAFTLAGGCTVWHAVNTGNGSMHSLTFLGGMLAAAWLHKLPGFLLFTREFQQGMFFWAPRMNALYRWIGAHTLYLLIGGAAFVLVLWINRRSFFSEEDL